MAIQVVIGISAEKTIPAKLYGQNPTSIEVGNIVGNHTSFTVWRTAMMKCNFQIVLVAVLFIFMISGCRIPSGRTEVGEQAAQAIARQRAVLFALEDYIKTMVALAPHARRVFVVGNLPDEDLAFLRISSPNVFRNKGEAADVQPEATLVEVIRADAFEFADGGMKEQLRADWSDAVSGDILVQLYPRSHVLVIYVMRKRDDGFVVVESSTIAG